MHIGYKNFSVDFDDAGREFSCFYAAPGEAPRVFLKGVVPTIRSYKGRRFSAADYKKVEFKPASALSGRSLSVLYSDGPAEAAFFELHVSLDAEKVHVRNFARAIVELKGLLPWGEDPENSTFGMRLNAEDHALRSGCGPAFSIHDDALFDRLTDRALEFFGSDKFRARYDWKASCYRFDYESGLDFGRELFFKPHEQLYRRKYNIPYAPISKRHGFETPPVGWMTWYAVQFDACEKLVLENAKALAEKFGAFAGKLVLWVDWEWNHKAFDGLGEKGVDTFTPRKKAYPRGLAPVAKALEKLGLIPALWIGATNDGRRNALLEKHPEWELARKAEWCGQYWIDPTHPGVVKEYIPAVFKQILKWGYKAIKWDCLPMSLQTFDAFHDKFHDKSKSSEEALRGLVKAARETVGHDVFMLSCSGETERDVCFAMDVFDAARVGGDIFGWEDFVKNSVDKILHFYPFHNAVFYADGDNLVLRKEFNNLAQARSRVSFYGLAGLPVTIGDPMRELDAPRVAMLRALMPVADVHPMDFKPKVKGESYVMGVLSVCRPFGDWSVIDVMNFKDVPLKLSLSLEADLHVPTRDGRKYLVFDFWNWKSMGVHGDALNVVVPPFDSAVLRVTPMEDGRPWLVSTSRHITQGATELRSLSWDAEKLTLSGESELVSCEPYRVALFVPEGLEFAGLSLPKGCEGSAGKPGADGVLELSLASKRGGLVKWAVRFGKA